MDTIHGYGQEYLGAVLTDVGVEQSVDVVIQLTHDVVELFLLAGVQLTRPEVVDGGHLVAFVKRVQLRSLDKRHVLAADLPHVMTSMMIIYLQPWFHVKIKLFERISVWHGTTSEMK